jgi:hypothetical protein
MIDEAKIVDLIERISDEQPTCACGRHTTPVWRDGVVWLECASLLEPREGALRRLLSAVTVPAHTHMPIVEVPPVAA